MQYPNKAFSVGFTLSLICPQYFIIIYLDLSTYSACECREKQQDLFNLMGAMYASVLFVGINNCSSVQPVVSVERTVFYRERAAGMYSTFPYSFAQV